MKHVSWTFGLIVPVLLFGAALVANIGRSQMTDARRVGGASHSVKGGAMPSMLWGLMISLLFYLPLNDRLIRVTMPSQARSSRAG